MVSQLPFPHSGQGGRCFVEPTSSWWPQFVQRYVPADTSLPAGTGLAMRDVLPSEWHVKPPKSADAAGPPGVVSSEALADDKDEPGQAA
jgi:hypothetical protein